MVIAIIAVLIVSTLLSLGLYVQIKIQSRIIELMIIALREKQESDYKVIKDNEHRISVLETINENKG